MNRFKVIMECVVRKVVTVECETMDQAKESPWRYAVDDLETDVFDWEVSEVILVKNERD